jgi:type IV secretory pathway TraG/TraD family ATPase VirD4
MTLLNIGKRIGKNILATGELLGRDLVDNLITTVDSFEAQDSRIYKSSFSDSDELLSADYTGFNIDGQRCQTRAKSYSSVMLTAATGMGKTSVQIINGIVRMTQSSQIINDPSGELFQKTSGYLQSIGYLCFLLNFGNVKGSHNFNPLVYVKTESDINKLCSLIIRTVLNSTSSDPFWNLQATTFLRVVVAFVLSYPPEYRNFANVRHILKALAGSKEAVCLMFAKDADQKLFEDFKMIMALEPKVFSSVLATALAATSLWADEDVCQITARNSFDFSLLRQQKVCIYLTTPTADSRYYAPLISMFFELFFKEQMSRIPEKHEIDCMITLEEASSAYIPLLPIACCNLRKYATGLLTTWQSYESAISMYGHENAEVIRSNSTTRIYMSSGSLKSCEELERMLGRVEVTDNDGKKIIKPLLLSEEIRCMDKNEAIVLSDNKNYRVKLVPYYLQPFIRMRTEIPPAQLVFEPISPLPLITIPVIKKSTPTA